jgi:hypothetical protein
MSIKKIKSLYMPSPDRIQLSLTTIKNEDYYLIFTRRVTSNLMMRIHEKVIALEAKNKIKPKKKKRPEVKEQKTTFPLGQEPLLVSKFGFLKKEELFPILSFVIEDKHTLNIPTPLPLLKSILEVLDKTQAKAGWNIVKQVRKVDHPLTKTSISKNKLH